MKVSSICLAVTGAACLSILAVSASAQSDPPAQQNSGWAVVNSRGDVLSSQNVSGVKHQGKGRYEVDFNGPVNKCAFTATIGGDRSITQPGSIVVGRIRGVRNAVMVAIYDVVTLVPENNRFMLNVSC